MILVRLTVREPGHLDSYVSGNCIFAETELPLREFRCARQAQWESTFQCHLTSVDDRQGTACARDRAVAIGFEEKRKAGRSPTAQTAPFASVDASVVASIDAVVELGKQCARSAEVVGKLPDVMDEFGNCHGGLPVAATHLPDDDQHGALVLAMQRDGLLEVAVKMLDRQTRDRPMGEVGSKRW